MGSEDEQVVGSRPQGLGDSLRSPGEAEQRAQERTEILISDPYEDVAIVYSGFLCERCAVWENCGAFDEKHMPIMEVTWQRVEMMAQIAKDKGWYVVDKMCFGINPQGKEKSWMDWQVVCPECRKQIGV